MARILDADGLTPTVGELVFDPPIEVIPMGDQNATTDRKSVPDAVQDQLFTKGMNTYAIVDAARVFGLVEILAASRLEFACLYDGDAAQDLADVAPYLICLTPDASITRLLFTSAPAPNGWWDAHPAAFVRSAQPLDSVRRHFRKYTRLRTEDDAWVLCRFWEADTMLTMVRHSSATDQSRYFELDHEYCALRPSGQGADWLRMRWAT